MATAKQPAKTNAARFLDRAGVIYRLVPYEVDEEDLGAEHLAKQLGIDINQVFKTLVAKGDRTGHVVFVVPGGGELDLKKAAKLSGNKQCAMIPLKELQRATGYVRGGCSPFAMKKKFPTWFDATALDHAEIHVSAGVRGLQIVAAPAELIRAAEAEVGDLTA